MSTFQLLIVCATVLIGTALILLVLLARPVLLGQAAPTAAGTPFEGLEPLDRVTVHLKDDQAIDGVVQHVAPSHVTLTNATLSTPGQRTDIGGLFRVPALGVVGLQEHPQRIPPPDTGRRSITGT